MSWMVLQYLTDASAQPCDRITLDAPVQRRTLEQFVPGAEVSDRIAGEDNGSVLERQLCVEIGAPMIERRLHIRRRRHSRLRRGPVNEVGDSAASMQKQSAQADKHEVDDERTDEERLQVFHWMKCSLPCFIDGHVDATSL